MGNMKGDSKNYVSEEFNLKSELSTLVKKNVIPSRIAERLEKKIIDSNVNITKEQLYTLAYKIRDAVTNYIKSGKKETTQSTSSEWEKSDSDMKKLVDIIERLEERVANIEEGKSPYSTDRINIPGVPSKEWEIDALKEIPSDPESIIILMKWMQYLIDKCGRDNLSNILDYYVDIGWLSEDVKISLLDYSHGITEDKSGESIKKDVSHLPSKDHIQSLIFIEKLKGKNLDKHFVDRIDGELERIMKKLNNYQFK